MLIIITSEYLILFYSMCCMSVIFALKIVLYASMYGTFVLVSFYSNANFALLISSFLNKEKSLFFSHLSQLLQNSY